MTSFFGSRFGNKTPTSTTYPENDTTVLSAVTDIKFQGPSVLSSTTAITKTSESVLLPATNVFTAATIEGVFTTNLNEEQSLELFSAATDMTSSAPEDVSDLWLVTPARGRVRTTASFQTASSAPKTDQNGTSSDKSQMEPILHEVNKTAEDNEIGSSAPSSSTTSVRHSLQETATTAKADDNGTSSDEAPTEPILHEANKIAEDSDETSSSTTSVRHFQHETGTTHPVLVPYSFYAKSGGNFFNRFGKPYCPGCDARLLTLPPRFTAVQLAYLPWFALPPSTRKPTPRHTFLPWARPTVTRDQPDFTRFGGAKPPGVSSV